MNLADIFRRYFPSYSKRFQKKLTKHHKKVAKAIISCRTAALGGEVYECPHCRKTRYVHHSCKNRHCPKCGGKATLHWAEKQVSKLLPVDYFMVTFTLPEELRPICIAYPKLLFSIFFAASSKALKTLLADPHYAGGTSGFLGVLHTWGNLLQYHPHIHYLVPKGAFDSERNQWNPAGHSFLVPVKLLSKNFREYFEKLLKKEDADIFQQIPSSIWEEKEFITNSEKKGTGKEVLLYLARYIHRVAICESRLRSLENDKVIFDYKINKANKSKEWKTTKLDAFEFIRRFMMHVLPSGFQKVRYYGFLHPASKVWKQVVTYFKITTMITDDDKEEETIYYCENCNNIMIHSESLPRTTRPPPSFIFKYKQDNERMNHAL